MVTFATTPLVDAVIANLSAAGLTVGDGEQPDNVGWSGSPGASSFHPYIVVHVFSRRYDGSIDDPFDDGSPVLSVSAYGAKRKQATTYGDRAFRSLQDNPVTITGRSVMLVEVVNDGAVDRLDDVQPPIWQDVQRFRIWTTVA